MPNAKPPSLSLTPGQCRAARGFLDWTQDELAERAGLSRSTIRDFEKGRHDLQPGSAQQVVRTLEDAGIVLIPASAEHGPGVCLRGGG
jgi:Predicted transcriptional regulators